MLPRVSHSVYRGIAQSHKEREEGDTVDRHQLVHFPVLGIISTCHKEVSHPHKGTNQWDLINTSPVVN